MRAREVADEFCSRRNMSVELDETDPSSMTLALVAFD